MRPRVFPAEDGRIGHADDALQHASMRPRVFPAEDAGGGVLDVRSARSFNEAAGIPRGRHPWGLLPFEIVIGLQ